MSSIISPYFFLLIIIFSLTQVSAQDKIRKLPPNINKPSINLYAPFVSGDGETIVYLSDYTDDGHHSMRWATKRTVSTWNDGREVATLINRPTLNYRGGYSLSFDGGMLLFTSRKSGLGGFDLWYSHRSGSDWSAPSNFGNPVNSRENEGAPMLSPDGEYLYFMRCDKMSEYGGASGCRILISKKTHSGWEEPEELPANINTGNSQTPRILADGETLIFASDQQGGKGGLDLFMTTKAGDKWTDPVAMDFINTEKDDQFISIPAKGRYLYADVQDRDRELVQILIPEEFQPKNVMRVQGVVTDAATGEPMNAHLTVFNIAERNRLWNEKTGNKGEFAIVLKEGAAYDVAVDPDESGYMFFSKIYDLEEEVGARDKEKLRISLEKISVGKTYPIEVFFEQYSSTLSDNSTFELRRIAGLLRKNNSMKMEIAVRQAHYREDSLSSDPDLTEVRIDSVYKQVLVKDSVEVTVVDSLATVPSDSLQMEEESELYEEVMEEAVDSVRTYEVVYKMEEQLELRQMYHNNRTEDQAAAIKVFLVNRGISEDRIQIKTSHSPPKAADDNKEEAIEVEMTVLQI